MILRPALPLLLALAPLPAMAQVVPDLELDNPRLQTVHFEDGQEVLLTVMPETGVTVMLERGETIQRIAVGDDSAFDVRVSPEGNSFLVLPRGPEESTRMQVQTDRRQEGCGEQEDGPGEDEALHGGGLRGRTDARRSPSLRGPAGKARAPSRPQRGGIPRLKCGREPADLLCASRGCALDAGARPDPRSPRCGRDLVPHRRAARRRHQT